MKKLSYIFCLLVGLLCLPLMGMAAKASAVPVANVSAATKLVNKLLNGQGTIVETFPAVDNLIGFVVKSSHGNNGILYADSTGKYLFSGSIVDANGQDLTQAYTNEYINSKLAGPAYEQASSLAWFADGSDAAPHKVYVIFDPNCIYCHVLYQQIQPLVDQGNVEIRWIPVAFRDPSSPGKAAAMLNAGSNEASSKLLAENEANFNDQTENGSLAPLTPNPSDKKVAAAFNSVAQNTAFFTKYGFEGTPTILYKQADGKVMVVPGLPRGQAFTDMINAMSANW